MKNVLFASTAIVAFAGAASAEVTLSGNAEMGLFDNDTPGTDAQFFTDVNVVFTLTGETESGLAFGTTVELSDVTADSTALTDDDDNGIFDFNDSVSLTDQATNDNSDDGGVSIFLTGAFGTLTMGDTDGGFDWGLTEVAFNSGSLADDETEHAGYSGNSGLDGIYDGQILRYDYSIGTFGFAASIELDDDDTSDGDPVFGLGVRYGLLLAGFDLGLGAGYQTVDQGASETDIFGFSANTTFAESFTVGVNFSRADTDILGVSSETDHYGIGVGYNAGALSLSANYGEFDTDGVERDGVGLSAGYDLGGGAVVQAGYGYSDSNIVGADDSDRYSVGFRFNF